jgi:hypothetical protein
MTTSNDDCTKLDQGDIRFYDNYVPPLGVGDYVINVTQRVNPTGTEIDECYPASQPFSVQGPRYTLPAEDVFSVFPLDNAQGVFEQSLPHVVLTKPDLPWENDVFNEKDRTKQTPWMALLVFVGDEVQAAGQPANPGTLLLAPSVAGWNTNRTMVASIPAASFYDSANGKLSTRTAPDANGVLWPKLEVEWYESADFLSSTACNVIDISPQAFATLIPVKNDLRYLSHARQVDPTAKDSTVLKIAGDGWYSIIIGKRLPDAPPPDGKTPGRRNIAHLVSLEGFNGYIGDTAVAALPATTKRVRLISLKSWTYSCVPDAGESFSELMLGLLKDGQGREKSTKLALPIDPNASVTDEARYAARVLANGYVPMRYQTRLGEQTFGWYRGPFSPVPVTNFISATQTGASAGQQSANDPDGWKPFATASSALIYDKTHGVFDLSYAVAWEAGRLMGLADPYFRQELLDWQRKGHALLDLIMERKSQIAALSGFDPNNPDPTTEKSLLDGIKSYAVTDDFMKYLVTQFSEQIAPKISGQPSNSPAAPMPSYPDMPAPPTNPQTIADLLRETDVQEAVREAGGKELEEIADWLARLYLLVGVPFENLVPHAALLPEESVRFFYLDSNWLDTLVEGALSIGIESSRDRLYQDLMKDLIWNTTFAATQAARDKLLGDLAAKTPPGSIVPFDRQALTGMLLRSAVVSGWPGLEVLAYTSYTLDAAGSAKPDLATAFSPLRLERLSDDVLLCIWPTVPAVVTIDEPHEGVAFGFEDPPPPAKEGYYLYLRSLATGNYGTPLCTDEQIEKGSCTHQIDAVATGVIDPATRSVDVGKLVGLIKSNLNSSTLRVCDFAVQMVKVPEQAVFAYPQPSKG